MTEATVTESNEHQALRGVNVMLMGPAGTGKTHAIGTLVDAGLEVFYLALEPGLESLLGYYRDSGKPIPPNLHWHFLTPPKAGFGEMLENAKKVNQLSLESLSKMADPKRSQHNQFLELITAFNDFPCDRTGQNYGAVDSWGVDRVLVVDGLTGVSRAAMSLVIGGKPVRNQSEWGIAQGQVENLLLMLTENCPCHFVLIGHVERETDLVLGGVKLMVQTLGKALPPKLPSMFSDVILAVREGSKWSWDTASPQADLKSRNLPIKSGLDPSFIPIITKWRSRGDLSTPK